MRENNNFIIYKVENITNGQVYIGATTHSINQRKLDHFEKAKRGINGKFFNAIRTFGADAFKFEQIDTTNSIDKLAQKEKHYIYEYKAKEDGYNSDKGGGFQKSVYQYSLINGKLINSHKCLTDASNAVNATKQDISRACLSVNKVFKCYYWSYNYAEPFKPLNDARKKEVLQLTIDGKLVARYVSVSEASKQTGYSKTCISRVCRGERQQSSGFIWRYK